MSFTVNDFRDLLHIIEVQPEWRSQLKRALFPDLDLEKSFQEMNAAIARLAIGQDALRHDVENIKQNIAVLTQDVDVLKQDVSVLKQDVDVLKQDVSVLKQDVDVLKQDVGVLKQDVSVLKQDVGVLKQDVSVLKQDVSVLKQDVSVLKQDVKDLKNDMRDLKGRSQEDFYRQRMGSIFSQYLRKGSEANDWLADLLYDKVSEGVITAAEVKQVMATDLLWAAETRDTRRRIVLALEASWLAEENDVERAIARAAILRRAGVDAFAMVGGHEWQEPLKTNAWNANVITTSNGRLDDESWLNIVQAE